MDQGKKKKKIKKKNFLGLSSAKSMDADAEIVDDATIVESLGPGFAFVKTSEAQEMRERSASDEEEEEQQTEEEMIFAAKKTIIAQEYQTPENAPSDTYSQQSIPLPTSSSMIDEAPAPSNVLEGDVEEKASVADPSPTQAKSVTIAEEHQVHEIPDDTAIESNDSIEAANNAGLLVLLEKAAENAGRGGMDVTTFARDLKAEWVTDVEALRRLDGKTLDDLLPIMLSRELQRLINHADSIDKQFLKEDRKALARGRSPKKAMKKKKKKKRSHRRAKKRDHHRPLTPPNGPLTPITEEVDSPGSVNSNGDLSVKTERVSSSAQSAYVASEDDDDLSIRTERFSELTSVEEESSASSGDENGDLTQSASIEDLEIRKLHANLIAVAREKFPTREALEVKIRERQIEVEAAVNSGFDVGKQTLSRAAVANDEISKLLPLRLILPTSDDLHEMISVLELHKETAMLEGDKDMAQSILAEVDELQDQINLEQQYLLTKATAETK